MVADPKDDDGPILPDLFTHGGMVDGIMIDGQAPPPDPLSVALAALEVASEAERDPATGELTAAGRAQVQACLEQGRAVQESEESFFGRCEKDESGHCKPGNGGDNGKRDDMGEKGKNVGEPLATTEEIEKRTREVRPRQLRAVNLVGHTPLSREHLDEIAASMEEDGWKGPPILGMKREDEWQAITGSHRLVAAEKAGLDAVPVVWVQQSDMLEWAKKAGYDLPPDHDFVGDLEDEDRLKILRHGDDNVAAEIMRQEVEKWE